MSDEVSQRCTGREVFNLIFANTEVREPVHPYQMQWMAHWSQASSSSSFQSHNHHAFANVIENQVGDNGRLSMTNSRSNFDSFCSEPKLPFPSLNLENFTSHQLQNSTGLSSEWTHFPMVEINRRIQPIVAPKKKTSFNSTKAKMDEQLLPLASSMPNYSENDLYYSGLAFKEHFANANLSYLKQGLCNSTKNSNTVVSEMKNNNLKFSGSSSSCPDDVPCPFIAEECSKQRETAFGRNKCVLPLSEPNKMPNCSAIGCRKRESQEFSNATQYLLITKEVGENSCYNGRIVQCSSVSAKVKGTAFYEKLTVPTMLYDHTDARFTMKENKNFETDIKHIDINELPSSPEVGNSSESLRLQVPQEDVNLNTKASEEEEDSSSSRTESVDALSKKPSNPPTESTGRDSDPSSKWVKRLQPNLLDCTPLSTKRFKKGHSSSSEMQDLLSTVVSYKRTICDLTGDLEKETPWLRRWCKRSASKETASLKETALLFEPENLKAENFEARQFPSLAAMALMGKQVTNYRPCEFRKRGSTTIWNI